LEIEAYLFLAHILLNSRGVSMAKVTVPVDGGEVVMYFGDLESGPDNLVRCQ